MASQKWIVEKAVAWLRKNPNLGAKDLQNKLSEVYGVEVSYGTAWAGRQKALDKSYESWDDSFCPYLILELNSLQSLLDQLWRSTPSIMKMFILVSCLLLCNHA